VFTVSSLVGGLAQSQEILVVARALQGVGAALAALSVPALPTTSAPDEAARHRALALLSALTLVVRRHPSAAVRRRVAQRGG
jgi:MFS family permease